MRVNLPPRETVSSLITVAFERSQSRTINEAATYGIANASRRDELDPTN
jgi:hypothetical protein